MEEEKEIRTRESGIKIRNRRRKKENVKKREIETNEENKGKFQAKLTTRKILAKRKKVRGGGGGADAGTGSVRRRN